MKKRLDYFDMAKGIGALLVLIGHLQGEQFFKFSPYIIPVCTWIFSFHMPLFFIISGMLINYREDEKKDFRTLTKKRFKGIMVPYFWFSFFYLLEVFYALITQSISVSTMGLQLWYVLSFYGLNVLWFLPALFAGEIIFLFVIRKYSKKTAAIIFVLITTVASLLNYLTKQFTYDTPLLERLHDLEIVILRPFLACTFIAIGYYIYFLFKEREKISIKELLIAIVLVGIDIALTHVNGGVDFRTLAQGNLFFYYICAISGSVGLILICKNIRPFKLIKYWGVNSLIFMAVHNNNQTMLFVGLNLAMYVNQYVTRARGYVSYGVVLLTMLVYVTFMMWLINKFFGFIIGKPSPFDKLFKKKSKI